MVQYIFAIKSIFYLFKCINNYFTKNNLVFTWSFTILALAFPMYSISGYYGSILSGKKKFDIQTKYFTIYSLISAIAIITAVVISKNVFWIILAFILSDIIVGNFFNLKSKKFLTNKEVDSDSINYGIKLSAIGVIGIIAQNIDKIILPILLGYQELAIYAIALIVPEQIKNLIKNIGPLTLPKFANTEISPELKQKIIIYSFKMMILIIPIIIIYWFSAEWIFRLIYPQYLEAVAYSKIFSLSLLVVPSLLITSLFQGNKKSQLLLKDNIFSSVIQIISVILLVYIFGLWGLITARLITRVLTFLYNFYLLKQVTTSQ